MRKAFIDELLGIARERDDIYIISGDAGFGVFEDYCALAPERFTNSGVAEASMIGHAAGLALTGFRVFVYNIIPFVLYRCYEQVRNDICYQRLPVALVGIGSGLTYAPGGMTHYSVEDLGLCQTLPNLTVISPVDPVETRAAVRYAAAADGPVYIRVAKAGEPVVRTDGCPDILAPAVVREGREVAVLAHGSVFEEAVRAHDELSARGLGFRLVSVPTLQPFPGEALRPVLEDVHTVVTLEEHFRSGGLASRLADWLAGEGGGPRLAPLALPDSFIHAVNKPAGMRRRFGIDAQAVAEAVELALRGRNSHGVR